MTNKEAVEMMQRAASEIEELRRRISQLEPKAHAYDSVAQVLRLLPQPSVGYGEDVAWMLRKRIKELQAPQEPGS